MSLGKHIFKAADPTSRAAFAFSDCAGAQAATDQRRDIKSPFQTMTRLGDSCADRNQLGSGFKSRGTVKAMTSPMPGSICAQFSTSNRRIRLAPVG